MTGITVKTAAFGQSNGMSVALETSALPARNAVWRHESEPDILVFQFGDVQLDVPLELGREYAPALAAMPEDKSEVSCQP